jgi:hypothetical protein
VQLSRGAEDEALDRFARELARETHTHLYTRESCANTWYAIGALPQRPGRTADAAVAFRRALERVARHPAAIALASLTGAPAGEPAAPRAAQAQASPRAAVHRALAEGIGLAGSGRHDAAAAVVGQALAGAEDGSQAWWLPVEPVLHVAAHPVEWAPVLAQLRHRAA